MVKRLLPSKKTFLSLLHNLALLTAGGLIFSFGAQAVAARGGFLTGDIYGLGILVWQTSKLLSPAIWFLLFNIPLFFLAWLYVGRKFFFYSTYGVLVTTFFSSLMSVEVPIHNQFYAAVASGTICGVGIGVMLRSLGAGSGLDVVGLILNKRWGIGIGQTHLYFNSVLFLACLLFINVDTVIVSFIQVYLSSMVMEKVMSFFSQRKVVFIMSDKTREIAGRITRRLGIGATFLESRGAYSGEKSEMIMVVANNLQLKRLEEATFSVDKHAMFIVENSFAVRGHRDFEVSKRIERRSLLSDTEDS